jgi:hypothetical protein
MGKAFAKANRQVSDRIVDKGRPAIRSLPTPGGTKAAGGLRASSRQNKVVVRLLGSNPTIRANVFGALSHGGAVTQTNPRGIYPGSGPWKSWIGRSWTPEQLYGLGPAIKRTVDGFALDEYMDAVLDGLKEAFPD